MNFNTCDITDDIKKVPNLLRIYSFVNKATYDENMLVFLYFDF